MSRKEYKGIKSLEQYTDDALNADGMVNDLDECGKYYVGKLIKDDKYVVIGIFTHPESSSAWGLIMSLKTGKWYEIDIPYISVVKRFNPSDDFKGFQAIDGDDDIPF